ncbi:MAG: hypothetical protein PHC88_04110 [Terrimicrobiaceae bacterium]|nr:hypothetical protein [Terrimicrobiaceae bacterium]
MKHPALTVLAAVLFVPAGLSHASYLGIDPSVLGDRESSEVEFAAWDLFAAATFIGYSPALGDLGVSLAQSVTAGPPYGPQAGAVANDLFYTFNKASDWTLSGTASVDIHTVVLQIKLSTPAAGALTDFFTTTLNGAGATPVVTAAGVDPGGLAGAGYNVLQWTWSGLAIGSGQTFGINFSNPAGGYHVALDAITLDVTPVPEPHEYALGVGALLTGLIVVRGMRRSRIA